eukprot:6208278-Pleurochrysis_carterae.AAC.7
MASQQHHRTSSPQLYSIVIYHTAQAPIVTGSGTTVDALGQAIRIAWRTSAIERKNGNTTCKTQRACHD